LNKRHIFLTGFMGAGKSKIGRLLAKRLAYPFFDSDQLIEQNSGLSINDLFDRYGETFFRELESDQIKYLCARQNPTVIALGGGALLNPENFERIRQNGVSVYIRSSAKAIFERVKHTSKRPLLVVEPGADFEERLLQRIESLLQQRQSVYEQADLIFDRDGVEPDRLVENLYQKLQSMIEPL